MLELTSSITYTSEINPDVSYKIRKMLHSRRVQFNLMTQSIFSELVDIQRQIDPIEDQIEEARKVVKGQACTCTHDIDPDPNKDPHNDGAECVLCKCRELQMDDSFGGWDKYHELRSKTLEVISYRLYPKYIEWGLAKVQGLKLKDDDDQEVQCSVENYLRYAPEDMIAELAGAIQRVLKLSPEEVRGFKLPTISDGQMGGQSASTTAPSVDATSTTKSDAAFAIPN